MSGARPAVEQVKAAYTQAIYRYGDVRARMRVRLLEFHQSIRLSHEVRRGVPLGRPVSRPMHRPRTGAWALSGVEGWRGEMCYMVMAGEEGWIHRCKVRDPSFANWPAIPKLRQEPLRFERVRVGMASSPHFLSFFPAEIQL